MHTLTLPFRKICSAIPAVALLSGGVILSASAAPTADGQSGLTASRGPAIVVPDVAMNLPAADAAVGDSLRHSTLTALAPHSPEVNPLAPAAPSAASSNPAVANPAVANAAASKPLVSLVSLVPAGTDPGSSTPVTLDSTGIPARALESYRVAASLTNEADPGCNIDWALVAAIGKVESNHARFGGNQLDAGAVAQPGIIGIALDGTNATARITDTDGGQWDGDTTYDRAVGPMQFIPGTWRAAGVDADGDGAANPQDMADAATSTAIYLCSGPGDLSTAGDLRSSIFRYNHSDSYVQKVTSIAAAYRNGVSALPASDLAPAASSNESLAAATSRNSSPVAQPAAVRALRSAPRGASTSTTPARRTTTRAPAPRTTTRAPAPRTTTRAPAPRTTTPVPRTTTPVPRTTTPAPTTTTPAPTTTTPAPTTTTREDSSGSGSGSDSSGSGSSGSGSGSSGDDD